MVIRSAVQLAVTPSGSPVLIPIPVAPVVVWVISVIRVLMHRVGVEEAAVTVLFGVTIMVPVALMLPQPPVKGIV